jgi:hypothetical protein
MAHEVVSKCGVHCIGPKRIGYGDFLSRIAQAGRQLALVKCRDDMGAMDDALLLWPDLLTIGAKTEWDDAGYSVDEAYNRIMAAHHIDPKVKYWEYFNERDGDYRQQADLYIALMPRLAHEGIGLCMFNCASGTPQLPSIDEAPYREIARACAFMRANDYDAILGLHEYSSDGNTIERHNALTDYLAARHALIPIAITEYGFETYYFDDAAYMALVKDNDPEYMRHEVILGCALWTLGGGGWASANYQTMLPELGEYIATVEPVEPEPPLPDDDFPPIVVTAHLVPQDTTSAEYDIVQAAALPNKNDVIFSADVAKHIVLHGQPGSKVIVWQPDRWSDSITDYLAPAQVELRYFTPPIPPGAPAWRGLHMRADGHSQVKDYECLDVARCDAAKIMTNTDFDELHMLIASGIAPDRIVLRLFADFRDRVIFPEDFYDWQRAWLGEFTRSGGRYVEIHNEPNLPIEGYGTSWATPQSWGNWYNEVARLIRGSYASVLIGWPGLSPQPNAPLFDDPLRASIMAGLVDWIGAHSYWLNSGGVDSPADGRYYTRYLGFGKPVIVTEFSNVGTADSDRAKGEQYAYYYATLESVVLGAFAFVSSASDPLFNQRRETWQRNGSLTDIPRAVGAAA